MKATPLVQATSLQHLITMRLLNAWLCPHLFLVQFSCGIVFDTEQKLCCVFCNITARALSYSIINIIIPSFTAQPTSYFHAHH